MEKAQLSEKYLEIRLVRMQKLIKSKAVTEEELERAEQNNEQNQINQKILQTIVGREIARHKMVTARLKQAVALQKAP